MKLYSYDHCPYCVKARMIFGLKSVPLTLKTLLNDDEKTPISMVGAKMLPILEKDDGLFLPESLEIISYVDSLVDYGDPIVGPTKKSSELDHWLIETRKYNYALAMPRWVEMGLDEFATDSAKQYFIKKKESSIGPFGPNIEITDSLIKMAEQHLNQLNDLMVGDPFFWGSELCLDDFHVFAALRILTTTKGLEFPETLNHYLNFMSEKSHIPLHWSQALGRDFSV